MNNLIQAGQIIFRSDERFWIFLNDFIYDEEHMICSPWFSLMGEQWRLVKDPYSEVTLTQTHSMHPPKHSNLTFRLWRRIHSVKSDKRFAVQLSLITSNNDFHERAGYVDSEFGCEFNFYYLKDRMPTFSKNRRVKLLFDIQMEESTHNTTNTNNEETRNEEEEANSADENKSEDEEDNENKMNDEEDSNEKKNCVVESKGLRRLAENLKQVFLEEKMCDAVLEVENREFKVHKVILIARSPVFASMFQYDLAEKNSNVVHIPDCTAESFEAFLHYLYTGTADTISTTNVFNLYYAADKYNVEDLKEKCVKFMKNNLSVETFFDTIALCLRHGETKLQKSAVDFFSANIRGILKTVQWQKYMTENPTHANELLIKAHNL